MITSFDRLLQGGRTLMVAQVSFHPMFISTWLITDLGSDSTNWQKTLSFYCEDDSIDIFPLAFVNVFVRIISTLRVPC